MGILIQPFVPISIQHSVAIIVCIHNRISNAPIEIIATLISSGRKYFLINIELYKEVGEEEYEDIA